IRRRLGLAEDSGAELGPSVRVRAAVESEAGRGDAAQAVRTAEAVQNVAKDNGANQSPRNASQSSPATTRNTAELQQAVAGESSQASQNGGKGGPSSDANVSASAEKFQEALRKLSGADAEVSVSGKGRASGRAEQAQSAAQVTAEAPAGAGQSQPAQATAATTGSRSAASQIAETVAENVNAGQIRSGRQLTVRLNPPELGSVRITFEANGEQLRGVLEVSNPRTLGELQREMPALMSRLSESGVQLRRMDLDLADNGGSGNSHLSDFADSQTQTSQRGASEVETPGEPLGQSAGGAETATAEVPSSTQIDDDAINVWI
ncbi:MAG: flagellar hook-length control protein FliK, partial [Phycisphaerae bacterium]